MGAGYACRDESSLSVPSQINIGGTYLAETTSVRVEFAMEQRSPEAKV
jgi:hypothetical protein